MVIWSESVADSVNCWTRHERYTFWINILSQLLAAVHVNSFNVRCTLVLLLAVIQISHKHFWDSRNYFACTCTRQYADNKTPLLKPHHTNMHLNAISPFLPFGALRLSNGPLKLEMSHWNKIEGAIWHIEKKVIPIPEQQRLDHPVNSYSPTSLQHISTIWF